MNNTGFFFCGLLVGVVVSAAFGLDFFPAMDERRGTGLFGDSLTDPSAAGSTLASSAEIDKLASLEQEKTRLMTDLKAATTEVSVLKNQLKNTTTTLEAKEAELARLETNVQTAGAEAADLERIRGELRQEQVRARRLEADLELTHQETYNLLKQFFASKRSAEDAMLVSEYFATSAPESLKGSLIDQLLQSNREVISSLAPASDMIATRATGAKPAEASLRTVSAPPGAAQPANAILEEDGVETKPDSAHPAPNSPAAPSEGASGAKSLPLPPPPGK